MSYGTISGNQSTGSGRDLGLARNAFHQNDVSASIRAHNAQFNDYGVACAQEGHRKDGDRIKSIVYGGLDGILTCFAIISGGVGGSLSTSQILILGISNVFADAFSMGVGDIVSTKAYNEHVAQERSRECWEFENYKEGEIEEMIELYEEKGLPREKARIVVSTMAKYKNFFIDIMMCEELQLKVPSEDDNPYEDGFIVFLSFLIFGLVPLLVYAAVPFFFSGASSKSLFFVALFLTMVVLFSLGSFKSKFSASSWWQSGVEFMLLGTAAATTSYVIGYYVRELVDEFLMK